jgi:late control gene D protein (GPD)
VPLGIAIAVNGKPDPALTDASTVEVHERAGEPTRYRVRYDLDIADGELKPLAQAELDPGSLLSFTVAVAGQSHCLVKGPVHAQQVHFESGGDGTWVDVSGADSSIAMDRRAQSMLWADQTDSDVVKRILGSYGYTLDIDTTSAGHAEAKHTLAQRETDLSFVRRLARRNGCLFWITCDARSGIETAHFKRPPLAAASGITLTINKPSPSLRMLELSWDVERPTSTAAVQLDLNNKGDLDGSAARSPLTTLGDLDLGAITGDVRSLFLAAPVDDVGDLRARSEGALIEAAWFIRASGSADLGSVGALVRTCTTVELDGAGKRHSGRYFVAGVRHTINPALHRMDIELVRNGWGK